MMDHIFFRVPPRNHCLKGIEFAALILTTFILSIDPCSLTLLFHLRLYVVHLLCLRQLFRTRLRGARLAPPSRVRLKRTESIHTAHDSPSI